MPSTLVHLPGGRTTSTPTTQYTTAADVLTAVLAEAAGGVGAEWEQAFVVTESVGGVARVLAPHTPIGQVTARWSAMVGAPVLALTLLPFNAAATASVTHPGLLRILTDDAAAQITSGRLHLDVPAAARLAGLVLAVRWGGAPDKLQLRAFEAGRLADALPLALVDAHMPDVWRALLLDEASKWFGLDPVGMAQALLTELALVPGSNTLWLGAAACTQVPGTRIRIGVAEEGVRVVDAADASLLLAFAHSKIKRWAVGQGSVAIEVHHLADTYQFLFETPEASLLDAALLACVRHGLAKRAAHAARTDAIALRVAPSPAPAPDLFGDSPALASPASRPASPALQPITEDRLDSRRPVKLVRKPAAKRSRPKNAAKPRPKKPTAASNPSSPPTSSSRSNPSRTAPTKSGKPSRTAATTSTRAKSASKSATKSTAKSAAAKSTAPRASSATTKRGSAPANKKRVVRKKVVRKKVVRKKVVRKKVVRSAAKADA